MSKYSSDDNRSMQLNDNNDRYYASRAGNEAEEYDEIHEGENDMGSPFFVIDNKLVKKSTVTNVVPHFECETEVVDNIRPRPSEPKQVVKLSFSFSVDIHTSYGDKFSVNLPKMEPEQRYENDEFAYQKDYSDRIQVITEESFKRISSINFGEVLHVDSDIFETRREEICNLYTLNIVQRYMNSIYAK